MTSNQSLLDQQDRDTARLSLDHNAVIEAGAGTGKTTLLRDRALFLLLGKGVPVTELVALTFTEKAAAEIRVRLSDILVELLAHSRGDASPENVRERCEALSRELQVHFKVSQKTWICRAQAAVEDMDKAVIGTLHSFAARLLRAYPLQAGVDPGFQVDEAERFEEFFESDWASWLDVELGERAPRERDWIEVLRCVPLEDLAELAKALCSPRADLDDVFRSPQGLSEWLSETVSIMREEPGRQPPAKGKMPHRLEAARGMLERLMQSRDGDAAPTGRVLEGIPGAVWPKAWDDLHRDRCESGARIAERASPEGEALLRRAAGLLLPFCRTFRRTFLWRGFVSFEGLLVLARDLVRDHPEVREELKSKFQAFLVDEFQDTDPLQGELLFYLTEQRGRSAKDLRDVRLEAGKLFVVGDPKQSIYRFRGADLAAYEGFVRHMAEREPQAAVCTLSSNFRSHDGLLSPVNAVFGKMMTYRKDSQPAYKPIVCASAAASPRSLPDKGVEIVVVGGGEEPAPKTEALRLAEARWIADWVLERRAPHRLKDIAVLLRTTTPLGAYLEVFKERDIPYVVESEKYFYGTQEALDYLNLLRVLDDPSDRIALAGLLRSPLVGLSDAELTLLGSRGGLDYLEPKPAKVRGLCVDSHKRLGHFYETLRSLRSGVGRKPLGDLVREMQERTHLLELLFCAYHGQQTVSNLSKLARLAAEASDARGLTLKGLAGRVARSIAQSREEGESPLADEHLDAVRILTIHKAKGLEFPVVFIPNLSGISRGSSEKPALRMDWGGSGMGLRLPHAAAGIAALWLEEQEGRREQDEAVRLLYVAMTRAKEKLFLLGSEAGAAGSFASRLQRVQAWPSLGDAPVHSVAAKLREHRPLQVSEKRSAAGDWADPGNLSRLAHLWKRRAAKRDALQSLPRHTSPTAASHEPEKHPLVDGDGAGFPVQARDSLSVGLACHRVLEHWDWKAGADLGEAISMACQGLSRQALEADWDKVRTECHDILSRFMDSAPAKMLSKAEILGREIPFVYSEGGSIVRGSIDILYRLEGRLWVADYKTDRVAAGTLDAAAQRYRIQGTAYRTAVTKSLKAAEVGFVLMFLRSGEAVELE